MSTSVRYGRATTISYKLTLMQKYGFRGTVSLSVNGTPPGTNCVWSTQTVNITSTSAFTPTARSRSRSALRSARTT